MKSGESLLKPKADDSKKEDVAAAAEQPKGAEDTPVENSNSADSSAKMEVTSANEDDKTLEKKAKSPSPKAKSPSPKPEVKEAAGPSAAKKIRLSDDEGSSASDAAVEDKKKDEDVPLSE